MIINLKQVFIALMIIKCTVSCQWYQYQAGGTCCITSGCAACASNPWYCSSCSSNKCVSNNNCNTACSSRLTQCSTCSSCTVCLTCSSNQYAINSSQCVLCSTLMTGCRTCSSSSVCLSCINNSYVINSSTCVACSNILSNCLQCSSSTVCTACINNNFVLNSSSCVTCSAFLSNCAQCSSSNTCTTCVNNTFILNSSTCTLCSAMITGCQLCSSPTLCTACINSSDLFDSGTNKCRNCSFFMDGCSTCSSSVVCTTCVNNSLAVSPSTNRCVTCQSLIADCLTCSSASACITCVNDTLIVSNSSNQCVLCSSFLTNCLSCSSSSVCTACVDNSFAINSSICSSCSDLMAGCLNCSSAAVCTNCVNDTFALNATQCVYCSILMVACVNCSSFNVCTGCANSTFALNTTNSQCQTCLSLMDNCINCTSETVCVDCANNTFYINSTTQKCQLCLYAMLACLNCNSSSVCINCTNNTYVINATSNQCAPCDQFMDLCTSCSSNTVCINCLISPNIILQNQKCFYCSALIPYCLNCTKSDRCTLCKTHYILNELSNATVNCMFCANAMAGCSQCSSKTVCTTCIYGQIVTNGCSNVPGCTSVIQKSTVSVCITCSTTYYYPQAINGQCICLKGKIAGQYCTQIIGCTNVIRTIKGDTCNICNKGQHFLLQNGTCVCQQYYYLDGSQCTDICGDGKVITLPCDDGNLIDNDGCSSICQIQSSYICKINSVTSSSQCIYKGWIKTSLNCINKLQNNSAEIILIFQPYVTNLLKSDFTNKISFKSDKNCLMNYFTVDGSNIHIFISYFQDVEGSTANVSVQYDQKYILSPNYTHTFQLKQCQGDQLLYDANPGQSSKDLMIMITTIYSFALILVWLIGSYSYKMIGVQTLHTFQLVFIIHAFATRYSPVVISFSQLQNTLNLFQSTLKKQSIISTRPYSRLNYSADFISNHLIVAIFQFIVLLLFSVFAVYKKASQTAKSTTTQKNSISKVSKYKEIIYDFLVFPIFIGFYLNLSISLIIQSNLNLSKTFSTNLIEIISITLVTFATFLIFFGQWKYILVDCEKKGQIHKKWYIPFYLTNIFLLSVIIQASAVSFIQRPLYYISGVVCIETIILIISRPYKDCIHNFSIIVNKLGIIINLVWIISQDYVYIKREKEQIIAFAFIGWMFLILISAVLRIIFELRREKSTKFIQEQIKILPNKRLQRNQKDLLNALLKQTSNNINNYRINSQFAREKQLQNMAQKFMKNSKIKFLKSKLRYRQFQYNQLQQYEHKISLNQVSGINQYAKQKNKLNY